MSSGGSRSGRSIARPCGGSAPSPSLATRSRSARASTGTCRPTTASPATRGSRTAGSSGCGGSRPSCSTRRCNRSGDVALRARLGSTLDDRVGRPVLRRPPRTWQEAARAGGGLPLARPIRPRRRMGADPHRRLRRRQPRLPARGPASGDRSAGLGPRQRAGRVASGGGRLGVGLLARCRVRGGPAAAPGALRALRHRHRRGDVGRRRAGGVRCRRPGRDRRGRRLRPAVDDASRSWSR